MKKAWLAERVPQCGYCQSGQIMSAADLLKRNPHPTRAEIVAQMSGHICRCGTYPTHAARHQTRCAGGLRHETPSFSTTTTLSRRRFMVEAAGMTFAFVIIVPAPPIGAIYGNPGFFHIFDPAQSEKRSSK